MFRNVSDAATAICHLCQVPRQTLPKGSNVCHMSTLWTAILRNTPKNCNIDLFFYLLQHTFDSHITFDTHKTKCAVHSFGPCSPDGYIKTIRKRPKKSHAIHFDPCHASFPSSGTALGRCISLVHSF
jgi:hypothetical protein